MPSLDLRTSGFGWVLGTGRCGSTLVHEVLARHPGAGFLSNVEDRVAVPGVGRAMERRRLPPVPDRLNPKGRLRYAPSEGYRLLEREVSPLLSQPSRTSPPTT